MKTLPVFLVLSLLLSLPALAADYERVLLPVFLHGVEQGAFGSQWVTELSIHNSGSQSVHLDPPYCPTLISPCVPLPIHPGVVWSFGKNSAPETPFFSKSSFVYVPASAVNDIHFNLVAKDISRIDDTFGTEVPVVRASDFRTTTISLLNIPVQPPYRSTLRLYHAARTATSVRVRIFAPNGQSIGDREVFLTASDYGFLERPLLPGYAEIGDLLDTARHAGIENVRVQIDPHDVPVWGFISVTNNITQQVTLVTPQRPL